MGKTNFTYSRPFGRKPSTTKTKSSAPIRKRVYKKAPVKKALVIANKNARAIASMKKKQLGPPQLQISTWDAPVGQHVLAGSPWLFQVNDPDTGNDGPRVYHINTLGSSVPFAQPFQLYSGSNTYNSEYSKHKFNPPIYLAGVNLEFELSGYMDNTNVRIDIIRQKTVGTTFWQSSSSTNYLPQTLTRLKNIAGFGPESINTKVFEIIKTKRVFFNSKATANVVDTAQDRNTTQTSTSNIKHCNVWVPYGKMLKTLDTQAIPEDAGNMGIDIHQNTPFHYQKQNPLSVIWCLISTDDQTDIASVVTGDALSVRMVRKCYWRDPLD